MSFNTFGTWITLLSFLLMLFTTDWAKFSFKIDGVHYLMTSLLFILLLGFLYFKEKRRSKETSILRTLHNKTATLELELSNSNYAQCQCKMIQLCSKISESFTTIKGTQISVCIKYINAISNIDYVETLARDIRSLNDDHRNYSITSKDKLNENYDFKCLVSKHSKCSSNKKWKDIYYLQNNIPNTYGYYNSHLDEDKLKKGICGLIQRHTKWELPYKSTLIVPITNQIDDSFYGFLCLDSRRIWAFNNQKDLELLRDVALCIWKIVDITLVKNQVKAYSNGKTV